MNIVMTGGTGFVGRHLTKELAKHHHIYIISRSADKYIDSDRITYLDYQDDPSRLPVIHAVINLAGESLYGYWTQAKKKRILKSRIDTTQWLIDFIKRLKKNPDVFINGSAIGYYGISNDIIFTEKTTMPGKGFLAETVSKWESTARQAEAMGIRTIYARFGVIIGSDGGALPIMKLPVKMFAGGRIGNGEQWLSWIHVEDVTNLIIFCMQNGHIEGPVNMTAPNPKRNHEFMRMLANVQKRPYWLPVPSFLIELGIGEMGQLITEGQYVLPHKAETNHYQFSFPYLKEALQQIQRESIRKNLS